ncbi:MAG: DUF6491 family protein [Sphingomonadaceae bacterium]
MPGKLLNALLAATVAGSLSACASGSGDTASAASAGNGRDCFNISQVSGFSRATNDQVYVHTGPSDVWLFDTFGYCPDLNFTEQLALEATPTSWVCRGIDVDLIVPSVTGPRECPVRMIRKLSKSESKAL